jgi:dolichol-phosphate mannosyltransferase
MFFLLLIGGLQLITLGVVGVYIGYIFEEVKKRPLYIVARPAVAAARRKEEPQGWTRPKGANV